MLKLAKKGAKQDVSGEAHIVFSELDALSEWLCAAMIAKAKSVSNALLATALARRDGWHDLPTVTSIDAKVAVQGDNNALGIELRHSDEARVRQGHGDAGVLLH